MGNVNQKVPGQYSEIPQQQQQQHHHHVGDELSSSMFTCEICIEPVTLPNKMFNDSNKCVHPFCANCMIKYIQVKLEDNISDIKCPSLNCHHSLEPLSCRPKITHQLFDKWCDVLCDSVVLGLDNVYCPNGNCSALIVNECGGNLKRCVCPNCKKPFCFRCKIPWHAGYTCKESGEIMDQNDFAFGVLYERKQWKRCPQCRHCIERDQGCLIVRCRCGIEFCYKCGKKVENHWCKCQRPLAIGMLFIFFVGILGAIYLLYKLIQLLRFNHA